MIKNIVFDMGGVLINFDAQRYTARFVPDPADYELIRRELFRSVEWIRMDRGSITDEQAVSSVCRRLPERLRGPARELTLSERFERAVYLMERRHIKAVYSEGAERLHGNT